jgi:urease accessory protein
MTIPRAIAHRPAGHWPNGAAAGFVSLDFDARYRRRIQLMSDGGEAILLELPKAIAMADGDGLQLDDGRWLQVRAAAELIVEVTHQDSSQLMRIAWHLGNRHLPTEIRESLLRIRTDHVIEQLLRAFGATLVNIHAPFQPEGGAYGAAPRQHSIDGQHRHE